MKIDIWLLALMGIVATVYGVVNTNLIGMFVGGFAFGSLYCIQRIDFYDSRREK